jgi:hypothetical protein
MAVLIIRPSTSVSSDFCVRWPMRSGHVSRWLDASVPKPSAESFLLCGGGLSEPAAGASSRAACRNEYGHSARATTSSPSLWPEKKVIGHDVTRRWGCFVSSTFRVACPCAHLWARSRGLRKDARRRRVQRKGALRACRFLQPLSDEDASWPHSVKSTPSSPRSSIRLICASTAPADVSKMVVSKASALVTARSKSSLPGPLVTSITEWVMTLLLRSSNAAAFTNATIKRCDFFCAPVTAAVSWVLCASQSYVLRFDRSRATLGLFGVNAPTTAFFYQSN